MTNLWQVELWHHFGLVVSGVFSPGEHLDSVEESPMPEKTIKRRLTEVGGREPADDDGPIFSTAAKLVDAL
jgi:hypothetical protein